MQRRFALLFIVLIFFLTLVPSYYPPNDEALRQNSALCDVYSQLFTATGTFSDINHTQAWTGVSLSWDISFLLPQYVSSSPATRAPPA
jgi:hypothetical protein